MGSTGMGKNTAVRHILQDLLEDNPKPMIRMLCELTYLSPYPWDITYMAKKLEVGRKSLEKIIPKLLNLRLIVKDRTIGRAQLYKVNEKSNVLTSLRAFANALIKAEETSEEMIAEIEQ
jgi:hypothetical protein